MFIFLRLPLCLLSIFIHGKRSDKETQSPMLKIFKDMMMKDKCDPEKKNLLKEKHQERKRKHYAASRAKAVVKTVSSSSEHIKKEAPYKRNELANKKSEYSTNRSQHSTPFQGAKRESWWLWGGTDEHEKKGDDDTCSCVSCALKKILSTDYVCIACVTVLFAISVCIAVMLIYKSVPCAASISTASTTPLSIRQDFQIFKRKADGYGKWNPKNDWRSIFSKREDDSDIMPNQGNELASLVDSENDLSNVLDSDRLSDIQHSDRLKDFYKKLVQTDAAIRNLRKIMSDNTNSNYKSDTDISNNFDIDSYINPGSSINLEKKMDLALPDRAKRSIKRLYPGRLFHFKRRVPVTESKINKGKLFTKSTINMTGKKKPTGGTARNKRFTDGSFVIEKNKVVIQYKPNRKVAKCSHAPKDSKSHETQLTHPFYKNTQRLDELLDKFMDKKLPFLSDRLEFQALFDKNKKCKHPVQDEIILVQDDDILKDYDQDQNDKKDQRVEENQKFPTSDMQSESEKAMLQKDKVEQTTMPDHSTTQKTQIDVKSPKDARNVYLNEFFQDSDGVEKTTDKTTDESTTMSYNIVLSISTLLNPALTGQTIVIIDPSTEFPVRANMRKLQQANTNEEEILANKDTKDGRSDYNEDHDDEVKNNDKNKRNSIQEDALEKMQTIVHNPTGVHNPNWKGPMPLYPDELTQMIIKQTTQVNKIAVPVHNRDVAPETDDDRFKQSDVDYVEDYLDDGYEKLVKLAQAYSDYGVLDEKKQAGDAAGKKFKERKDERESSINSLENFMKKFHNFMQEPTNRPLVENFKRGKDTFEDIRMKPYSSDANVKESHNTNLKDLIEKHLKFVNDHKKAPDHEFKPESEYSITTTKLSDNRDTDTNKFKESTNMDLMPLLVYKKRTLKFLNKNGYDATNKMENIAMDSKPQDQSPNLRELYKEEKAYEGVSEKSEINEDKSIKEKSSDSTFDSKSRFASKSEGLNEDKLKVNTLFNPETNSHSTDFKKVIPITTAFLDTVTQDQIEFQKDAFTTETYNINDRTENKIYNLDREADTFKGGNEKDFIVINDGKVGVNSNYDHNNKESSSLSHLLDRLAHWLSDVDKEHTDNSKTQSYEIPKLTTKTTPISLIDSEVDTGFKSRMLLSVDINSNNTEKIMNSGDVEQIPNIQSTTEPMNANMTRTVRDTTVSTTNDLPANGTENHIFKRQAIDDSNLIFWNDLYDEEYGVNADPLGSNIRDKHSIDKKDFIKRSNTWIQDKVKQIANKFYLGDLGTNAKVKNSEKSRHVKRSATYEEDEEENSGKLNLNKLTARMKKICKETARAVQDTRHVQVREENQQEHATSNLMQQLVRLMTDLVDFQVHERTCRKLPADLKHFLDWLTSSKDEDTPVIYADKDEAEKFQQQLELEMAYKTEEPWLTFSSSQKPEIPTTQILEAQLSERSQRTDCRTDCLGTLHAVQNLIREYEEMSEDDKSVMTGVKNYLESQMHFLQTQLASFEDSNNRNRYKRDLGDVVHTVSNSIESTASTLGRGMKNMKKIYHKYKCKVKNTYKDIKDAAKAAKDTLDKNRNNIAKPKAKPKEIKHIEKEKEKKKIHQEIKHTDVKHNHKLWGFHHKNKNKAHKDAVKEKIRYNDYVDDDFGFSMSKDKITDYEAYMDEPLSDKQERNVKDVYLISEEAEKVASKGSQPLKDGDIFDKTDIFRINDYSEKG